MNSPKTLLTILNLVLAVWLHAQKFEELTGTPPMGWNSWNKFACDVNEQLIRETADAMVAPGMKDAGYEYIVIDDCWHGVLRNVWEKLDAGTTGKILKACQPARDVLMFRLSRRE